MLVLICLFCLSKVKIKEIQGIHKIFLQFVNVKSYLIFSLQEVNLGFCEIKIPGGQALAEAMENKENLVKLELDGMYFYMWYKTDH